MLNNKMMKALITIMNADNSNQTEWLISLRVVASQLDARSFLTRGRSRSRRATRMDIMTPAVKIEDNDAKAKEDAGKKQQPIVIEDFGELDVDDVEAAIMGDFPIFLATNSHTEPELAADTVTRMKLYQQLLLSTPHHAHKVRTCQEGDCYGYVKLILKNVRVTGQSRYNSVIALQAVKFLPHMSISELASALKDVQMRANRFKKDAIDDDIMKGALLSLAQGHIRFERLATDYSKPSCTLSYDEIIDELQEHEANTNGKDLARWNRQNQSASMMVHEPEVPDNVQELAALLTRTFGLTPLKRAMAKIDATEACRNFQKGRCHRDPCRFSHSLSAPSAATSSTSEEKQGNRKRLTCYNCQKVGYHMASECTAPRQERTRPRGAPNEQANHTGEAATGASMDVAAFMEQLRLHSVQQQARNESTSEHANVMFEAELALDDIGCPSPLRGAPARRPCVAVSHPFHTFTDPDSAVMLEDEIDDYLAQFEDETDDYLCDSSDSDSECETHDYFSTTMARATATAGGGPDITTAETASMLTEVALSTHTTEDHGGTGKPNTLLLDSAASSHYLLASDAPLSASGKIQLGTDIKVNGAQKGSGMQCLGKMECMVRVEGGGQLELDRVLLLPDSLRHRLVSVGQLTRTGYGVMFFDDRCVVVKDGITVLSIKRSGNNLYPIIANNLPAPSEATAMQGEQAMATTDENGDDDEQCYLASSYYVGDNFAQRCHVKFNHASVTKGSMLYIKLAKEHGRRFTDCPPFTCMDCLFAKVHCLPHPRRSAEERARRDGGGKIGKVSLDSFAWPYPGDKGEKVGTIMTDRRQLVPIATRTRDETPGRIIVKLKQLNKSAMRPECVEVSQEIFKVTFVAEDGETKGGDIGPSVAEDGETKGGDIGPSELKLEHIHYLKTDGAAEFMGSELTTFCEENGIEKKASCGHTQQQNPGEPAVKLVTQGIAILHRQLPLTSKWVYAFRFFCHVYGLLPNTGLPAGYDTPYEAAQQRTVDFKRLTKHVHPYGCLCILHIPKVLRAHTHGVDKGLPCAFLGFSVLKEGFVVLTLGSRTVIDGVWDVFFIEDRFPIAELHEEKLQQGLPIKSQQVTKRWAGVDLSWHALVTGDFSGEAAVDTSINETGAVMPDGTDAEDFLPVNTMPANDAAGNVSTSTMSTDTVPANAMPITDAMGTVPVNTMPIDTDGLTDWADMPRLEPTASLERLDTTVADSTVLHIKKAMLSQRNKPNRNTMEQPESGPRRSGRTRQPSHENLIAIANLPPKAPSPAPPVVIEGVEDTSAPSLVDLDEYAMLTSVQKEAAAAYTADPTVLPAPESYSEAIHRTDSAIWIDTMRKHLIKLRRIGDGVYRIVPRKLAGNVMKSSWVFARKVRAHHEDGQTQEDSARAVAGGYGQVYGLDYTETYCPTMPMESYKANEAGCINDPDAIREEYDFSGAYYHSFPTLKQHMEQPPGMGETPESYAGIDLEAKQVPDFSPMPGARSKYVWELLRCMPGTKDAGHNFNEQMSTYLVDKLKLQPNPGDGASFYGNFGQTWLRLNSYVDDLTAFSNSQALMDKCFDLINERFPCKRLAGINLIVGVTVTKSDIGIAFDQKRLIEDVAEYTGQCDAGAERSPFPSGWTGFTKDDCVTDPAARAVLDEWPYPNAVGKVAYVARSTRYEVLWIVSILQRHFKNFGPAMIKALLRLVRYLYTTRTKPLIFKAGYPENLHPVVVMVDASYSSSQIDGSSHEGGIIFYKGCPIHAMSRRQRVVALSSMESEFMGANTMARTGLWIIALLRGFGLPAPMPFPIMEDNSSAIYLSRKRNLNGPRTRHMEVRWHWLQQQVMTKKVVLHHLRTYFQVADILTKGLDYGTFKRLADVLLGHVPLWEYGDGVLRRALDPSNALTPEAMMASSQHSQAAQRPSVAAQEQAAMMYGSRYSGDVTGDGAATRPSSTAQEQAAMMYGSRYSGDVTGDGAGDPPRFEFRVPEHKIIWPDLRPIGALLYPGEHPTTNSTTLRRVQLTANVLGGGDHAAEELIRHLAMLPMMPAGVLPGPESSTRRAIITRGVGELDDMVAIASAMVYITASRIAFDLYEEQGLEEHVSSPPATVANIVETMRGVLVANGPNSALEDNIAVVRPPPAAPFMPPPQYEEDDQPDTHMTRARLLAGERCNPGARAWSIPATQETITRHGTNPSYNLGKVGITKNGRCYHHVTCNILLCKEGPHRGMAYHGAVVIQLASNLRVYNASRAGTEDALVPCGFCQHSFLQFVGRQPC